VQTDLPIIACSLSADGQRERLDDWRSLLADAESREPLGTGMRFRFRTDLSERVRTLAAAEHECCSFLRFTLVESDAALVLTVETEEPGLGALRLIFG
jgi:hypothetical protein